MTVGHRLFTAEGNGFDALGGDAEELQALLDGFGTLLTEGEVVLAAARSSVLPWMMMLTFG